MPTLDGVAADLAWLYKREFLTQVTLPNKFVDTGPTGSGLERIFELDLPVEQNSKVDVLSAKLEVRGSSPPSNAGRGET